MLPREVDLGAEFEVSRGVARETIRALGERGLISVKHGRGATVNEPGRWDVFDPDVLAASLESEHAADVLGEYLECRRVVEVEAAGMVAERAGDREIERLAVALEGMEHEAARPPSQAAEERFHEADIRFHQALIAATGNRALGQLVGRIHSALLLARFPLARPEYREEIALPEHRRILDAVAAGDAGAARQAMSDHLDTVAAYLGAHRAQRRRGRRRTARSKMGLARKVAAALSWRERDGQIGAPALHTAGAVHRAVEAAEAVGLELGLGWEVSLSAHVELEGVADSLLAPALTRLQGEWDRKGEVVCPAGDACVSHDLVVEPAPTGRREGASGRPDPLAWEVLGQLALDALRGPGFGWWRAMPGPRVERPRLAALERTDARDARRGAGSANRDAILDVWIGAVTSGVVERLRPAAS